MKNNSACLPWIDNLHILVHFDFLHGYTWKRMKYNGYFVRHDLILDFNMSREISLLTMESLFPYIYMLGRGHVGKQILVGKKRQIEPSTY